MVYVNDTDHIIIDNIIYDFFHTRHPFLIDRVVRIVHVIVPGYRNTNCVKSCALYKVNQLFGSIWVSPAGFCSKTCCSRHMCIQSITKVPSKCNGIYDFMCCTCKSNFACLCCIFVLSRIFCICSICSFYCGFHIGFHL